MAESFDVFITAFDLFGKIHEKKLAIILHLVYYNKCAHEVSTPTTNMDH